MRQFSRINPWHPLARWLLSAWPVKEGGSVLMDMGPVHAHGAIPSTGFVWQQMPKHGQGIDCDHSKTSAVPIGPSRNLIPISPSLGITIVQWINTDQLDAHRRGISIISAAGTRCGIAVAASTYLSKFSLAYRDGAGTLQYLPMAGTISAGVTYCVAVVIRDGYGAIYVDGVLEAETTAVSGANTFSVDGTTSYLGSIATANVLNGRFGTTLIFGRQLHAQEIAGLYGKVHELFSEGEPLVYGGTATGGGGGGTPPTGSKGGGQDMQTIFIGEATTARRRVYLDPVDAVDGATPELSEAGGQPQLSVNGGAFSNTANTLVHTSNGHYYVELSGTEYQTPGIGCVRYKSANTQEVKVYVHFVSFDPYDANRLGLSYLNVLGATIAELTAPPVAAPTMAQVLSVLSMVLRGQIKVQSNKLIVYNDAGTAVWEYPLADDGTFTRSKAQTPT